MRPSAAIAWANCDAWLMRGRKKRREKPVRLQKDRADGFRVHPERPLEHQPHELAGGHVGGAAEGDGVLAAEVSVHIGVGMLPAFTAEVEIGG